MFFVANLRVSSLAEHDIDAAINLARTYIAELRVQVRGDPCETPRKGNPPWAPIGRPGKGV